MALSGRLPAPASISPGRLSMVAWAELSNEYWVSWTAIWARAASSSSSGAGVRPLPAE